MSAEKPFCGAFSSVPTDLAAIIAVITFFFTLKDIATGVFGVFEFLAAGTGPIAIFVAALLGSGLVLTVVSVMVWQRCASRTGVSACCAGVVNEIEPGFSNWWQNIFPFSGMHDRVDLVVKCDYWPLVEEDNAAVKCTVHDDPVDQSPILQCFFYNPRVCQVGIGSAVGAGIAAPIAVIVAAGLGALAFAGMVAAIGCATVVACVASIVVGVIVAFVAAVILTLAAALIVGWIVLAATSSSQPGPAVEDGSSPEGTPISVGDYLSVPGNYIRHEGFENTIVAWWAEPESTLHGRSSSEWPPFVHRDPDENLQPDACPAR